MQDITKNKKFWKTNQSYFCDKGYNQTKITIVEKDSINYFTNITKKPSTVSNIRDIDEITKHFDGHISVCKIKKAYSEILQEDNFGFEMVSMDEVKKVVLKLNSKKSFTYGAVTVSFLKQSIEVHLKDLTTIIIIP